MGKFLIHKLRQNTYFWGIMLGVPLLIFLRAAPIVTWLELAPPSNAPLPSGYIQELIVYFGVRSLFMGAVLGCLSTNLAVSQLDHDTQRLRATTRISWGVMIVLIVWMVLNLGELFAALNYFSRSTGNGSTARQQAVWFVFIRASDAPLPWAAALFVIGKLRLRRWTYEQKRKQ